MRRREFITLLGGTAAWSVAAPLAGHAQHSERIRRIGVLMPFTANDPEAQARNALFEKSLRELGWMVGRRAADRLSLARRRGRPPSAETRRNWLRSRRTSFCPLAARPLGLLLQATSTIPIVFVNLADPVGAGFVQSLARPGGNATGFTNYEYSMSGKWVELLKQIAPNVTRVAVFRDPTLAAGIGQFSCNSVGGAVAWG